MCEIERKFDLSVKGKERIFVFAVCDFVVKIFGGVVTVLNGLIVLIAALERSHDVNVGRCGKVRFRIAERKSDFGLEHAVLLLQSFNAVRVEVRVDVKRDAVEFSVLHVRFEIQSHTRKRAEFAKVETEHVLDEPDDIFGDKTLNERNYADDKSEIARNLENGVTVAVINEFASRRTEQNVDDELFDGERDNVHVDKALDETADIITHNGVEKNGRKVEIFKTCGKFRNERRHVDIVRPDNVHAFILLYAAQIRNEFAFVVVNAHEKFAFSACRHCANRLVVEILSRKFSRFELSELDENFTRIVVDVGLSVDSACKTHRHERVIRVFVETEYERRVHVYVSRIFLVRSRGECCFFEHLPRLLRTERFRIIDSGVRRRGRNDRIRCASRIVRSACDKTEQQDADHHRKQYDCESLELSHSHHFPPEHTRVAYVHRLLYATIIPFSHINVNSQSV